MNPKVNWLATDLWGQSMMFLPLVFLLTPEKWGAFLGYLSVGTWQTLSCIRYHRKWRADESLARRMYYQILRWTLFSSPVTGPLNLLYFFLVFISPALAIWYFGMTVHELRLELRKERAGCVTDAVKNT